MSNNLWRKWRKRLAKTCSECMWKLGKVGSLFSYLKFKFIASEYFFRNRRFVFHSQNICAFCLFLRTEFDFDDKTRARKKLKFFCLVVDFFYIISCEACDKHEFLGTVHTGLIRNRHCMTFFVLLYNCRTERELK